MRRGIEILRFMLLIGLMAFLFSFSKKRNANRTLSKVDIEFMDGRSPFITHKTVNKLLIQSKEEITGIGKETIALKEMERRLNENPMVRNAQVYVTIDGVLGAKIEQRDPIGRIFSQGNGQDYYLDSDGKKMPLSEVYSARVPIITGISENHFEEVTELLLKIRQDDFMRHIVVGLEQMDNGEIQFRLRKSDLRVLLGRPVNIDRKFQNFKAFYKKTKQDSTLFRYDKVNLKFESQVIATKKEGNGR